MSDEKVIVDPVTGDIRRVALTEEEIAERTERMAAAAARMAAREQAEADDATLRAQILAMAADVEGVKLTDLTAAQVKRLLGAVLYRLGAVDQSGVVQPLADWAKR